MNGEEIKTLVKKAASGDTGAFGALYEIYAADLYRFALYNMKNTYEAQDAVQNCALKAFTKIKTLKDAGAFRSWIMKILLNECRKLLRAKKETPCENMVFTQAGDEPVKKAEITGLLELLPEQAAMIVQLSVFEDCTSEEIAQILEMKAGTVRSVLARSLKKLRIALEEVQK